MPWSDEVQALRFALGRRRLALSPGTRWRNRQFRREASLEYPVPPERLLVEVAGSADLHWFIEGGQLALDSIAGALDERGIELASLKSVLDFGCGVGRVLRHWPLTDQPALYGTDINPLLIEWSTANLPLARFATNRTMPPIGYGDATFDLIYALSVFTHLPEALQTAWIDEMERILKPGGYLLITVHGDHYLPELDAEEQLRYREGRLVVRNSSAPGSNFCAAFHPTQYIRDELARSFKLLGHFPEAAAGNPFQDIVLFQKPDVISRG